MAALELRCFLGGGEKLLLCCKGLGRVFPLFPLTYVSVCGIHRFVW